MPILRHSSLLRECLKNDIVESMNTLIGKEKILYEAVANKNSDRDYLVAFQDYIGFLAEYGTDLLLHLGDQLLERNKKVEELDVLQDRLTTEVISNRDNITKIVGKLNIKEWKVPQI